MVWVASRLYAIEIAYEQVNRWLESWKKQVYQRVKVVIN